MNAVTLHLPNIENADGNQRKMRLFWVVKPINLKSQ